MALFGSDDEPVTTFEPVACNDNKVVGYMNEGDSMSVVTIPINEFETEHMENIDKIVK